ncbi:Uncharacterised protein [Kluyvera cryocrescens]|uniref:Uncharacterized protein n=1 Tax=Kluyvera cryocrescens TaxID=580 RepID=A0A485CT49_KLUCR|nr:Uncharacterised protein [Kluyvera cryocrescens]
MTNTSWILRDSSLHTFALPCTAARQALVAQDESDALRHKAEQKEIDRVTASAKRLATWDGGTTTKISRVKPSRWKNRSRD